MEVKKRILQTIYEYMKTVLLDRNIERASEFLTEDIICCDLNKKQFLVSRLEVVNNLYEKTAKDVPNCSIHIKEEIIKVYDKTAIFMGKIVMLRDTNTEEPVKELRYSATLMHQEGWKICASHYSVEQQNETMDLMEQNISGGILSCYMEKDHFPLRYVNENLVKLLGYTKEEFQEKYGEDVIQFVYKDDIAAVSEEFRRCMNEGKDWRLNHRIETKDGNLVHMLVRGRKSIDASGREIVTNFSIDVTDIHLLQEKVAIQAEELEAQNEELMNQASELTAQAEDLEVQNKVLNTQTSELVIQAEELEAQNEEMSAQAGQLIAQQEALEIQNHDLEEQAKVISLSEKRFRIALSRTKNIIFDYDIMQGQVVRFDLTNSKDDKVILLERVSEELIEGEHVSEEDTGIFHSMFKEMKDGSLYVEKNICTITFKGDKKWYKILMTADFDKKGNPIHAIGAAEDVTEQKVAETDLRYQAEYDSLTKVYNKRSSMEKIEEKLATYEGIHRGAFMMLDVDCFKNINDTYGHPFGDNILKEVSEVLKNNFRETDVVGRIGGDEFCIFVAGTKNIKLIQQKADIINQEIREIFLSDDEKKYVTASIGITTCRGVQKNFAEVYKEADKALYHAKKKGRDTFCFYGECRIGDSE